MVVIQASPAAASGAASTVVNSSAPAPPGPSPCTVTRRWRSAMATASLRCASERQGAGGRVCYRGRPARGRELRLRPRPRGGGGSGPTPPRTRAGARRRARAPPLLLPVASGAGLPPAESPLSAAAASGGGAGGGRLLAPAQRQPWRQWWRRGLETVSRFLNNICNPL